MTGFLAAALFSAAWPPGAAAGVPAAARVPSAPGPARATWSLQHTPDASGRSLLSVSCASATACTATGTKMTSGTNRTIAEGWNGTAWSAEPTPAIPGGTLSFLRGVSCSSATSCTAAGDYSSGAMDVTLAEHWNGAHWSIEPTPNPPGSRSSYLFGISCPAARSCTAVGDFIIARTGAQAALTEHWNGSAWAIQPTPNPRIATNSYPSGVSCASATACAATGYFLTRGRIDVSMAMGWNGSRWSIERTARPAGATASFLDGVSCTPAAGCTAVGDYTNGAPFPVALAERRSAG